MDFTASNGTRAWRGILGLPPLPSTSSSMELIQQALFPNATLLGRSLRLDLSEHLAAFNSAEPF